MNVAVLLMGIMIAATGAVVVAPAVDASSHWCNSGWTNGFGGSAASCSSQTCSTGLLNGIEVEAVDADAWVDGQWVCGGVNYACSSQGTGDFWCSYTAYGAAPGFAPCYGWSHEAWPSGVNLYCGRWSSGFAAQAGPVVLTGCELPTETCEFFARAHERVAHEGFTGTLIQFHHDIAVGYACESGMCIEVPARCERTDDGVMCGNY